jgi:phosphomannomutase/phosphoglucomutase
MSIFKACDIRGVYPRDLDEPLYDRLGRALGTLLRQRTVAPAVLVGGDVRPSTPSLRASLIAGLVSTGCRVSDLGTVPTPLVYFAARRRQPDGLAVVTASHNPPNHNGLKLSLGPLPITEAEMARVERTLAEGAFARGHGSVEPLSVEEEYLDFLAAAVRPADGLCLVLDCGNGTSSALAPRALRRLGCDVLELFCTPDGAFPNRSPNPALPENLTALCQRVREAGARLGVALDGDGDRLALVDDLGRPLTGDQAIILLARHALRGKPPGERVVCDLKCSQAVLEAIQAAGGVPLLERSGHAFIKARMLRENALFGGELSGHFFYRELAGGDDALYSILRVAELLNAAPAPLSAVVDALPHYAITPDLRIPYAAADGPERIERLAAAADGDVLRLDGVRVAYPDGWALARCSVTEPLLTFRFEATAGSPRAIAERFLAPAPDLLRLVLERLGKAERIHHE